MKARTVHAMLILFGLWSALCGVAQAVKAPAPDVASPSAYVGIVYSTDNPYGVTEVHDVIPGSPAALAGVRKGDIIVVVLYDDTAYSFVQAVRKIPPVGLWEPKVAYVPSERFVDFVIRRRISRPRGLFEGLSDLDFETVVVSVRWAAAPAPAR